MKITFILLPYQAWLPKYPIRTTTKLHTLYSTMWIPLKDNHMINVSGNVYLHICKSAYSFAS